MLDPSQPQPINLNNFSSYINNCLDIAKKRLKLFKNIEEIIENENRLNQYPRLNLLEKPKKIITLNKDFIGEKEKKEAQMALLKGQILLEHTCAGEATRLGLGTKFLINPPLDLQKKTLDKLITTKEEIPFSPQKLLPLTLGRRHMLQLAWDLSILAKKQGENPSKILKNQTLLIIINKNSWGKILEDFKNANFYGFSRKKVLFMIQEDFHGISFKNQQCKYELNSSRRLHNHGQMFMQTAMDNQIFYLSRSGQQRYLSWHDYRKILKTIKDKVSFNIEDLDYLEQSLDIKGIAAALKLGKEGINMIMEVVANNKDNPQKGGLCAWDPQLQHDVMIESFQLAEMSNDKILYLNKNINHYPNPSIALSKIKKHGLSMPITVKNNFIYFQPIQGDLNFLVKTAFVQRKKIKAINSWKNGNNTIQALISMAQQENRIGFIDWCKNFIKINL